MSISAAAVKEVRERTNAPMMDCKRALEETKGNIDAAIEVLRKSGQAKADKKAGRTTAEGAIVVQASPDNSAAVMLEINSETDFVARHDDFKQFAGVISNAALKANVTDLEALLAVTLPEQGNVTVEQARRDLIAKIGENIQIRRLSQLAGGTIGVYVHGGRIGVLVQMQGGNAELAKDVAMHIAASNPQVIAQEDVPPALIEQEEQIFAAQAQQSGKPAEIVEKMIEGRIKKFVAEISLLGQPFVKNPDITVADLLRQQQAKVIQFICFTVGEGIEKKADNFADEVMAQVRGS
jgi:elongation factor Ts